MRCSFTNLKGLGLEQGQSSYFLIKSLTLKIKTLHSHVHLDVLPLQPEFDSPISNVSVAVGENATFTCIVRELGAYRVSE